MSEWRAGSDHEQEEEEGDAQNDIEALSAPPTGVKQRRPTKAELQRADDEAEYEDDGGDGGAGSARKSKATGGGSRHSPSSSASKKRAESDDQTVLERVSSWVATKESTLGVIRSPAEASGDGDLVAGSGLTPDLRTQPWFISGGATMHPHQISALNWLKQRWELGISAILADEMGLGKTLCAIAMMAYLMERAYKGAPVPEQLAAAANGLASPTKAKRDAKSRIAGAASAAATAATAASASSASPKHGRVGPFLILCPLTVLDNWSTELSTFAPSLVVQTYAASKVEREDLATHIASNIKQLNPLKSARRDPLCPFHILLTTYECAISDVGFLSRFRWRMAIVDEAHRLKNAESLLSTSLLLDYTIEWKLLLTGTPVQNNMSELWGLLHFLAPELFDNRRKFVDEFDILAPNTSGLTKARIAELASLSPAEKLAQQTAAMENLHALMRPFMLRRLKSECNLDIPPKREVILRTAMTPLQKDIYRNLLLKNHELIGAGGATSSSKAPNARALVNIVASLRKCCSHPYLFSGVEPEPFVEGEHIIDVSGKFRVLSRLLKVLKRLGKRVLLFSTSVQTLDVVQDCLGYLGYSYERLDGSVRGEERYEAIAKFKGGGGKKGAAREEEETFVFLLSTRAGGVGLNLVCADCVIFLDSDWNPQMDLQAQARAHRIGQTKSVLVVRLLAANTLEEITLKRTQRKLAMTHNILEKGRFNKVTAADGADDAAANGSSAAAAGAPDGDDDAIGRSAADLQNILQYGLDSLFGEESGDSSSSGAAAASSSPTSSSEAELTEQEIEAIVTGKIEETRKAAAATAASSMHDEDEEKKSAESATAVPDARPAFKRIATRALPSLEAASLDPVVADADSSVYVYEGTDYKVLSKAELGSVEEELSASAAAGHKALQRMVAQARASGALEEEAETSAAATGGYSSPNVDRKRKAATQETEAERAARIVRQRESAQKRADAAARKRAEAEASRLAELAALWADNGYESKSVVIDPVWEAKFAALPSGGAAAATATSAAAAAVGDASGEWTGADSGEEKAEAAPAAATLSYVIGDVSRPFVFEREDGQAGKTSQPPSLSQQDAGVELELNSSFDECAAAAASEMADEKGAASSSSAAASAALNNSPSSALVLVPVDASGRWGKGGLFRALDARSSLIGAQYELIGSMQDLHMGDVHVVTIPADQVRAPPTAPGEFPSPPSEMHVALCVILQRAKNQSYGAPAISPEHLSMALRKLAWYSLQPEHRRSIHLPRLAQDDPNIGWYGVERQLQKCCVSRGVPTFVYYFKRRRPQYRSPVKTQISRASSLLSRASSLNRADSDLSREVRAARTSSSFLDAAPAAAASASADVGSSTVQPMLLDDGGGGGGDGAAAVALAAEESKESELSALSQYHDIFTNCIIYLHRGGADGSSSSASAGAASSSAAPSISDADVRLLTRFLSAYDGQVSDEVTPRVTHIVTAEPYLTPQLLGLKRRASQRCRVVPIAWVESCVMQGVLDESNKMVIGMQRQ